MKIVILGTRGIPARYGGFETFAEELSSRLVARGHKLTVYSRHRLGGKYEGPSEYKGVRIRSAATIMHKYLETPLHAFFSFIQLRKSEYDVALLCNAANAPFAFIIRLIGIPFALNVDGIERKRSKWNSLGRLWYRLGEKCSVLFANRVVADAQVIAHYYKDAHRCESTVIAYGASATPRVAGETLKNFGLQPRNFILYVSRLEPENNALGVIQAYEALTEKPMPLVIVGDAPYAAEYKAQLRKAAGPNVIFAGYQYGEAYQEFQSNCYVYIQATEVGGTHPALIESMAYGNCVIANGTDENREVLADAGCFYPVNDFSALSLQLQDCIEDPSKVEVARIKAKQRANEVYTWEKITKEYEDLFQTLVRARA